MSAEVKELIVFILKLCGLGLAALLLTALVERYVPSDLWERLMRPLGRHKRRGSSERPQR